MKKTNFKIKISAAILAVMAAFAVGTAAVSANPAKASDGQSVVHTVQEQQLAKADIVGSWTYNVGSNYMGISFKENGAAIVAANELARSQIGSWTIRNNKVKLNIFGADSYYVFKNGILYNEEHPSQFFTKDTDTAGAPQGARSDAGKLIAQNAGLKKEDVVGTWSYNVGSSYMGMVLNADGTAFVSANELAHTLVGTWSIADNKVKLSVSGGDSYYIFENGRLFNEEHRAQFFTMDAVG